MLVSITNIGAFDLIKAISIYTCMKGLCFGNSLEDFKLKILKSEHAEQMKFEIFSDAPWELNFRIK